MDSSPSDTDLTLRSPDEVLAAVPYLLGFHPSDSVVLVGLDRDAVAFTARADLPPGDDPHAAREMVRLLARITAEHRVTDVVILGYGAPFHVDPSVLRLEVVLAGRGLGVRDVLRVRDGRYWSYLCHGAECCPPEGREFDVASTRFAATATLAGRVALPDREALEVSVAPVTGAERTAMREALAAARSRLTAALTSDDAAATRQLLVRRIDRDLDAALARLAAGDELDAATVGWLATALTVEECCERAWHRTAAEAPGASVARAGGSAASGEGEAAVRGRLMPGGWRAGGYLELWRELTRRAAPSPAAASLLAYAAWLAGEGALAATAVERALTAPDYLPARVMAEVINSGVSPRDVAARLAANPQRHPRRPH